MAADERRLWRQYVQDVLRPEPRTARPSRRALVADGLLAIFLTVVALMAAEGLQGPVHRVDVQPRPLIELLRLPQPPAAPSLPAVPSPPALPDGGIGVQSAAPERIHPPSGAVPEEHEPPVLLVALTALPLAARRRYPLATFWVVASAVLAMDGGETWVTVLACFIAGYSAVAHSRNRVPAAAGLLLAAVLAGVVDRDVASGLPGLPGWLGPYVVLLSAGAGASVVRFLRRSRDRLTELQRAQEDAMRRAVEAERSRIAAELHDVVTHNVSVMVIQAGAARKVMDAEPELSKQALLAIESSGRAAMAELRNVMDLLAGPEDGRVDGRGDGLEPQPGLDQLGGLVERVRAAGVPVDVALSPLDPLPDGVGLTVYRVVQEGLTNTMKHAAGATASVAIGRNGGWLEIEVTDAGGAPGPQARTGNGRGLIGLRERLAVYGGTLAAGPVAGGGYRIMARIPWTAA
ncbi:histidine kinase [Planomonospora sp. ID91781]|uniref:sensor histidine kinase n=1 Tax=Planomonospora sp. ID91781 TaxID=2738135 RepID=UPI0027DD13D0|nr:histidine kinase [Planomonospora sp. ID91781]